MRAAGSRSPTPPPALKTSKVSENPGQTPGPRAPPTCVLPVGQERTNRIGDRLDLAPQAVETRGDERSSARAHTRFRDRRREAAANTKPSPSAPRARSRAGAHRNSGAPDPIPSRTRNSRARARSRAARVDSGAAPPSAAPPAHRVKAPSCAERSAAYQSTSRRRRGNAPVPSTRQPGGRSSAARDLDRVEEAVHQQRTCRSSRSRHSARFRAHRVEAARRARPVSGVSGEGAAACPLGAALLEGE